MDGTDEQGVAHGLDRYREFPPPRALKEYIFCFWTQTIGSPAGLAQRVVPDGCVDFLVLNDAPMVVGPWTEPFVSHLTPGTKIVGARCHPGLAPSLLGIPASELLNQYLPLCDVWAGAQSDPFARIVEERSVSGRIAALQTALLERAKDAIPVDRATKAAVQWIAQHPQGRVEQLSEWLGLSSRQIQRRFTSAVGYGPKLLHSVFRLQRLLNLAETARAQGNLAQFALNAGYADQSHMTREVRRFSGEPPSVSLKSPRCALRLSGLVDMPDAIGSDI
jgi:AraC-like DNA-binding protein